MQNNMIGITFESDIPEEYPAVNLLDNEIHHPFVGTNAVNILLKPGPETLSAYVQQSKDSVSDRDKFLGNQIVDVLLEHEHLLEEYGLYPGTQVGCGYVSSEEVLTLAVSVLLRDPDTRARLIQVAEMLRGTPQWSVI